MMSDVPVFYDCEASCTGGLPIEIGWAFIYKSGEIQSESHLVKPPLHWDMQPVWDPDAEKLHGISLAQLHAQGRPPFEVARRMNGVLAGNSSPMPRPMTSVGFASSSTKQAWIPHSRSGEPTLTCSHRSLQRSADGTAPVMRPPSQKRTAFRQERIVLKRMLAIGLCFGVRFQREPQHGREPSGYVPQAPETGQEGLLESSQNRFRAVRVVFIANDDLHFVDCRGLFFVI